MTDQPPLKPCPFCGGEAEWRQLESTSDAYPCAINIKCSQCHHTVMGKTWPDAVVEAVASWNRRTRICITRELVELAMDAFVENPENPEDGCSRFYSRMHAALVAALSKT